MFCEVYTFALKKQMNIVIVGATSGIGRELWKTYATSGNKLFVLGRRIALLEQMKREGKECTSIFPIDITQTDETKLCLQEIKKECTSIDLIIVCAGIGDLNDSLDYNIELETINTNVVAWTHVVDCSYKILENQGQGHLVTLTSVGGLTSSPLAPAYAASKAYQINYTKSLQQKSKGKGIWVTEIRPGLVDTAMAKGEGLFWVMPTQKVVHQVTKAIAHKRKTKVVTKRWAFISFILKHF